MNVTLEMLNDLRRLYEGDGDEIHPFCNPEVNINPILQKNNRASIQYSVGEVATEA